MWAFENLMWLTVTFITSWIMPLLCSKSFNGSFISFSWKSEYNRPHITVPLLYFLDFICTALSICLSTLDPLASYCSLILSTLAQTLRSSGSHFDCSLLPCSAWVASLIPFTYPVLMLSSTNSTYHLLSCYIKYSFMFIA